MDTIAETEVTSEKTELVDEDQNDLSMLNATITTKKRSYRSVEKTCSIEDGIASKVFTDARNYSKRTALQKRLPNEQFDDPSNPVFKQNKSGFLTQRPVEWMRAIEDYAENETDVNARWTYKADESGMIHECDVATWFDTTTEVTLTIFISTGVVIVHGQAHRKFVETEFDKIRSRLVLVDSTGPSHTDVQLENETQKIIKRLLL